MENLVKTKKFSIVELFKALFSNNEIDDEASFSAELKQIREQESASNIANLEKQVKYEIKPRRERKVKTADYKMQENTINRARTVARHRKKERGLER